MIVSYITEKLYTITDSICTDWDLRLVDDTSSVLYREGMLQFCMDNKWEYLVVTAWNENEAHVACRQLGFLGGGAVLNFAITLILSCMYICSLIC